MLKVHTDLDVEFVAFELYELEVTEPREDFELEIARATQAVRAASALGLPQGPSESATQRRPLTLTCSLPIPE